MLKAITPRFIKKLDTHLLENYPVIWTSKIHFAAWHGLTLLLISLLLGLLLPFNLISNLEYEFWYTILCVIAFVPMCIWTYHYMIFNKEKQFGAKKPGDAYLDFLLVFFTLGIFILAPWPLEFAFSNRVANSYTEKELVQDINTLNETWLYVVDSEDKYKNWTDTSKHENGFFTLRSLANTESSYFTSTYMEYRSKEFPELLSGRQIAMRYNPDIDSAALGAKIGLYISTAQKYLGNYKYNAVHYTRKFLALRNKQAIATEKAYEESDYEASTISSVIQKVCQAKYHQLFFFDSDYFLALFFVTFCLSILLTLFKLVNWKQYLLLAVVAIFYPILAIILSELFPIGIHDRHDNALQFWFVFFVAASFISLFLSASKPHFRPALNILNQAFYVLAAFLPYFAVLLIHDQTGVFHNDDYNYSYYNENVTLTPAQHAANSLTQMYDNYWYAEYQRWLNGCLWAGIAVFFLCLPWLKGLFFKQLALPKRT